MTRTGRVKSLLEEKERGGWNAPDALPMLFHLILTAILEEIWLDEERSNLPKAERERWYPSDLHDQCQEEAESRGAVTSQAPSDPLLLTPQAGARVKPYLPSCICPLSLYSAPKTGDSDVIRCKEQLLLNQNTSDPGQPHLLPGLLSFSAC